MDKDKLRYDFAMQSALAATIAEIVKGVSVNPAGLIPANFLKFYRQYGEDQQLHEEFQKAISEIEQLK